MHPAAIFDGNPHRKSHGNVENHQPFHYGNFARLRLLRQRAFFAYFLERERNVPFRRTKSQITATVIIKGANEIAPFSLSKNSFFLLVMPTIPAYQFGRRNRKFPFLPFVFHPNVLRHVKIRIQKIQFFVAHFIMI